MTRVKNRNMSPINGWHFHQPQTGAKFHEWDFSTIVSKVIEHRKANGRFGLATDLTTVQDQIDEANALRMASIPGGEAYVMLDSASPPKTMPRPFSQKLHAVAVGAKTLVEWISSGVEAVAQELANKRAEVCAKCPLNDSGDWTRLFTVPAQEAIRAAINQRREWNLKTDLDAKLFICSACLCPLPLKVWMPIQSIVSKMPKESYDALDQNCWIRAEDA